MATFNKFHDFVRALGEKEHDLKDDTFKVYLTNAEPSAADDAIKTDLAEITNENGYTAPVDIQNGYTETAGVGTMTAVDVVITASGGTVGPFRYAVIYNDSHTSDGLMGWVDYGSAITLQAGESFTVDFNAVSLCTLE
jgi:hypothetical protein